MLTVKKDTTGLPVDRRVVLRSWLGRMSASTGVKPVACFRFVHFGNREQGAKPTCGNRIVAPQRVVQMKPSGFQKANQSIRTVTIGWIGDRAVPLAQAFEYSLIEATEPISNALSAL